MERLAKENLNTPQEYDEIFKDRQTKKVDKYDLKRWNLLSKYFTGGKLIDIGCLDSLIPVMMKIKHPSSEVYGLDHAEEAIKFLQQEYPMVTYLKRDLYNTGFPKEYFNYAIMGEVIEHLEDPEKAIKEAMRILKPRGTLALSTPMNEAVESGAVDGIHHLWSFEVKDIKQILSQFGKVKVTIKNYSKDKKATNAIKQFLSWEKKNKVEWLASELVLASKKYLFAGTLDAVARVNGVLTVIDFKTSSMIGSDAFLQVAAYWLLLHENLDN